MLKCLRARAVERKFIKNGQKLSSYSVNLNNKKSLDLEIGSDSKYFSFNTHCNAGQDGKMQLIPTNFQIGISHSRLQENSLAQVKRMFSHLFKTSSKNK